MRVLVTHGLFSDIQSPHNFFPSIALAQSVHKARQVGSFSLLSGMYFPNILVDIIHIVLSLCQALAPLHWAWSLPPDHAQGRSILVVQRQHLLPERNCVGQADQVQLISL